MAYVSRLKGCKLYMVILSGGTYEILVVEMDSQFKEGIKKAYEDEQQAKNLCTMLNKAAYSLSSKAKKTRRERRLRPQRGIYIHIG